MKVHVFTILQKVIQHKYENQLDTVYWQSRKRGNQNYHTHVEMTNNQTFLKHKVNKLRQDNGLRENSKYKTLLIS